MSDTGFPAGRGGIGATGTDVAPPPTTTPEHGGSGVKDQMQDAASTAPDEGKHVSAVAEGLAETLASLPDREGSRVIYGGSAGPRLLTWLSPAGAGQGTGPTSLRP